MYRTLFLLGTLPMRMSCFPQGQTGVSVSDDNKTGVTDILFKDLEELSRLTDISYCVSYPGIQKPFECPHHCDEFIDFELVETFNTGILTGDSAGYVALSHSVDAQRIIIAFRGTQSLSDAVIDISTALRRYPAPEVKDPSSVLAKSLRSCSDCTVHNGFFTAWEIIRSLIFNVVADLIQKHPAYQLTLVGHSLGGAVATFAALEFVVRGWNPTTTTFGSPRIGNRAMARYIDAVFNLTAPSNNSSYRRVTHIDDPVPLLPPIEYGYHSHGGEIYISNPTVPPTVRDLKLCTGDEDSTCIAAGKENFGLQLRGKEKPLDVLTNYFQDKAWRSYNSIPALVKLFSSHMDYFLRLGDCLPNVNMFDALQIDDKLIDQSH